MDRVLILDSVKFADLHTIQEPDDQGLHASQLHQ